MKQRFAKPSFFDMQFVTSSLSTLLVLLLLGLVVFSVLTARDLSTYVRERIHFSVILPSEMKESEVRRLEQRVERMPFVKESQYISKEQALKEHIEDMGVDPTEFLGYNPLKASIEIKLKADYANSDSIARIETFFKEKTNIQEVLYRKELIDGVNRNLARISVVLIALAVILTFISFGLINNTVRLSIYAQRFTIHTMKLVGAEWSFIRRPFLVRSVWSGVVAALGANTVLTGGAYWAVAYQPDLIAVVTPMTMLTVYACVLVFGVVITWLCAFISMNKYLRMKSGKLYTL